MNTAENKLGSKEEMEERSFIDIYGSPTPPKKTEYAFFSKVYGILSKMGHMLATKLHIPKIKRIQITLTIFSDQHSLKLGVNYKQETAIKL